MKTSTARIEDLRQMGTFIKHSIVCLKTVDFTQVKLASQLKAKKKGQTKIKVLGSCF